MARKNLSSHGNGLKTQAYSKRAARYAFFDSMVMYGWLADRQQRVVAINHSLRDWVNTHGHEQLAEDVSARGVGIKEFLVRILRTEDMGVGHLIEEYTSKLARQVESLSPVFDLEDQWQFELDDREKKVGDYFVQKSLHIVDCNTVVAGARVVKTGALRMSSNNERDRVDIITVCQIEKDEGGWRVVGFQGQLQQAWLRVQAVIGAGTQAGTVGLLGRSLSHNIGSHALFYLEVDEEDTGKKDFYRYLRERMELLAGFSTYFSLSSTTVRLGELIKKFARNRVLLERIVRSERVKRVNVVRPDREFDISLPAGSLGAQALYTILENNIRDSAKHGRSQNSKQNTLTITIEAREPEDETLREDYVEIIVSDNRRNYKNSGPRIEEALANLRIVDELGQLETGNWGLKERIIAAAILRGIRLETIAVRIGEGRDHPVNFVISDTPAILRVVNVNGNLGWGFYLMKPKDILLVTSAGAATGAAYSGQVTRRDMQWLAANIDVPKEVRHKIVVIRAETQAEADMVANMLDKLPHRVFLSAPDYVKLFGDFFAPLDEESLSPERLSLETLYSKWVAWLVKQKAPRIPVPTIRNVLRSFKSLFSDSGRFSMPEVVFCEGEELTILAPDDSAEGFHWEITDKRSYRPERPLIVFDSHGTCKIPVAVAAASTTDDDADDADEIAEIEARTPHAMWAGDSRTLERAAVHYEPHDHEDYSVRQFADSAIQGVSRTAPGESPVEPLSLGFGCVEAALIKILIVDERLDPVSRETFYNSSRGWSTSKNELFHWKGVDIKGREYGRDEIPGREKLLTWLAETKYDFLVLHKGIVDKLINHASMTPAESMAAMRELFVQLKKHVPQLIIHSGRMSLKDLPPGCKFMPLSNVDAWLRNNYSKMQIVEDICLLRRV